MQSLALITKLNLAETPYSPKTMCLYQRLKILFVEKFELLFPNLRQKMN